MKFNTGKFNVSPFNVSPNEDNTNLRFVVARGVFSVSKPTLKGTIKLRFKKVEIVAHCTLNLSVRVPLSFKKANITTTAKLDMTIVFSLRPKAVNGIFSASKAGLRTFAFDTINLTGLILYPGDTLVIDTDEITVEKNGINVIEYWQTGSTPFEFSNGDNILTYTDDSAERNATASVVWRNRWL